MSSPSFEASVSTSSVGERLSALMDGELEGAAVSPACAAWRDDPQSRATWHAYHLIGDVMRSDDLASTVPRDAAFLSAIRGRLAQEPVVLAPATVVPAGMSLSASTRFSRRIWRSSAAVAAGFVVVAGALLVTRDPGPDASAESARQVAVPAAPVAREITTVSTQPAQGSTEPEVLVANGKLIRDAQLDRYLAAHKQFAGSSALGVPSAFLRSATTDATNR